MSAELPAYWFSQALAAIQAHEIEKGMEAYKKCFDWSYSHSNDPAASLIFMRKYDVAQALSNVGYYDTRGLEMLDQLMPFYTGTHITDSSFWGMRDVPFYEDVMELELKFYKGLEKTREDWIQFCDRVIKDVNGDGKAFAEVMKTKW